jgi:glc operon protein GlcG
MKTKFVTALLLISATVFAQTPAKPPVLYGEPITLQQARKIADAAQAFAVGKQWTVVVVIVDTGGNLVLLEKLDNTQLGSIDVAILKAKTANNFKRPTKVFEDGIAGGGVGLRITTLPNAIAIEGGEPIYSNGKIIGGIGVSGMQATEDGEVVKAALASFK